MFGTAKAWTHNRGKRQSQKAYGPIESIWLNIHGAIKRKTKVPKTTNSKKRIQYPVDQVKRKFKADNPNELWV